ncbi:MAG: bifunctional folylpolyglutamate synthase/dihydrofolate synthase [Ruminococcaceae bacterium]|nr:bifunctional folylpolyglutamate synthase/dihydrofolate synthase [Oscillospiraceae bacterium]
MTYKDAIDYIHSVVWKGSRPGLSRITELLSLLGDPQDSLRFIHIAGTNGKGSTSAMTESILRAAGYKTGLFVSPYIKHFNERICFCGTPISDQALAEVTAAVKPFADSMADAPTEFELITAIGLLYFKNVGCDVVVLETGMGGRLDSTNVIKAPLATVITGIALDHTEYLGDTVEQIAAEKAGIIKKGAPMVYGGHNAAARGVIKAACDRVGVSFYAAEDTPMTVLRADLSGTTVQYGKYKGLHLPLLGAYQPQNLATVLTLFEALADKGMRISESVIRQGIAVVRWRGRFERLCTSPLIISDGAHNPEGIAAAASGIRLYFGDKRVLMLCAVMADKDYHGMVGELAPLAEEVFTLTPDNPRALPAADFAAVWRAHGVKATGFDSVEAAVRAAVSAAAQRGLPLFSLGSLYMYAEVTDVLERIGILDL